MKEFPKIGCVYIDNLEIDYTPIEKRLENSGRKYIDKNPLYENYLIWDEKNYWFMQNKSSNKLLYTIQELLDIVNNKTMENKELTIDDLVEGETYKYIYNYLELKYSIGKCRTSKSLHIGNYIVVRNNKTEFVNHNNCCTSSKSYVKATEEEIQWLNECIKQGKFVELSRVSQSKPEFIIGKWYKWANKTYPNHHYFKLDSYSDSSVFFKERIYHRKYEEIESNWSIKEVVECDLSEIQEYLPYGHIDKQIQTDDKWLIKRAKILYPINTKIYQLYSGGTSNKSHEITIHNHDFTIDSDGEVLYNGQYRLYTPINDTWATKVEEQPKYEVVHCKTQEEWDFVCEKTNSSKRQKTWEQSRENSCISLDGRDHDRISYWEDLNYKIYSFKEWCDKFNYVFVPEQSFNFKKDNSYSCDGKYETHLEEHIKKGYTEITFDQFKRLVLPLEDKVSEAKQELFNSWKGFVVGKLYQHNSGSKAYFVGVNNLNQPIFELVDYKAVSINDLPKDYIPKGNGTYWRYEGLEKEFEEIKEPNLDNPNIEGAKEYLVKEGSKLHNYFNKGNYDKLPDFLKEFPSIQEEVFKWEIEYSPVNEEINLSSFIKPFKEVKNHHKALCLEM